jgi:hypothetical protein
MLSGLLGLGKCILEKLIKFPSASSNYKLTTAHGNTVKVLVYSACKFTYSLSYDFFLKCYNTRL